MARGQVLHRPSLPASPVWGSPAGQPWAAIQVCVQAIDGVHVDMRHVVVGILHCIEVVLVLCPVHKPAQCLEAPALLERSMPPLAVPQVIAVLQRLDLDSLHPSALPNEAT